jgi:hypothetical protein
MDTIKNVVYDWCTFFPDVLFGSVDISYACYRHDMAYSKKSWEKKLVSDIELILDVWYLADQATGWRRLFTKALAPCMGFAVLTIGSVVFALK